MQKETMDTLDSIENKAHRDIRREKRRKEKEINSKFLSAQPNSIVQERQWRTHMYKTIPDITIVRKNLV